MRTLTGTLLLVLAFGTTEAAAHHKPGHNPPGHQKHDRDRVPPQIVVPLVIDGDIGILDHWLVEEHGNAAIVYGAPNDKDPFYIEEGPSIAPNSAAPDLALAGDDAFAIDPVWRIYRDPDFGFEIEVPFGLFEPTEAEGRGLRLREPSGGSSMLNVYGVANAEDLSPDQFSALLEGDDRISEVTYRASGNDWFVLSGYYSSDSVAEELIFYAKFMFSADRTRLSAFEISYPTSDGPRFDGIIARLEDTLSAPL